MHTPNLPLSATVTPAMGGTIHALAQRQLALPGLLFLAGHRPLAFVMGQAMYVLAPLAMTLGIADWLAWAALLSHPDGPTRLEDYVLEEIAHTHSGPLAE